jgi:hypothetical protein
MYNETLSLLNPTHSVNDKNINLPLAELKENIDYILSYTNGNKQLLPALFGNLWDYTKDGKKFLLNGGKFDTYKKCQVWSALYELAVVNDSRIIFDSVGNRMVYVEQNGVIDTVNPSWIEREIYIPESLRGQQVLFSMKAAGSSSLSEWSASNSLTETIGVEIGGSLETERKFFNVGKVDNFYYYNAGRNTPDMTTIFVPFNVGNKTSSVKIKIFRTTATGFLHIDKVFVGGLTLPYEDYSIRNLDINEFYDFFKAETKINATTICGHSISDIPTIYGGSFKISGTNMSDIVTYEGLTHYLREILNTSSVINYPVENITSSNNFNYLNLSQGFTPLIPGEKIYTITHGTFRDNTLSKPMVNIIAPNISLNEITGSSNVFFVHSLFDIQQSSFKVILSDAPTISGYQLSWNIGNTFSPLDAVGSLPVTMSINPEITGYNVVFDYEQTLGG